MNSLLISIRGNIYFKSGNFYWERKSLEKMLTLIRCQKMQQRYFCCVNKLCSQNNRNNDDAVKCQRKKSELSQNNIPAYAVTNKYNRNNSVERRQQEKNEDVFDLGKNLQLQSLFLPAFPSSLIPSTSFSRQFSTSTADSKHGAHFNYSSFKNKHETVINNNNNNVTNNNNSSSDEKNNGGASESLKSKVSDMDDDLDMNIDFDKELDWIKDRAVQTRGCENRWISRTDDRWISRNADDSTAANVTMQHKGADHLVDEDARETRCPSNYDAASFTSHVDVFPINAIGPPPPPNGDLPAELVTVELLKAYDSMPRYCARRIANCVSQPVYGSSDGLLAKKPVYPGLRPTTAEGILQVVGSMAENILNLKQLGVQGTVLYNTPQLIRIPKRSLLASLELLSSSSLFSDDAHSAMPMAMLPTTTLNKLASKFKEDKQWLPFHTNRVYLLADALEVPLSVMCSMLLRDLNLQLLLQDLHRTAVRLDVLLGYRVPLDTFKLAALKYNVSILRSRLHTMASVMNGKQELEALYEVSRRVRADDSDVASARCLRKDVASGEESPPSRRAPEDVSETSNRDVIGGSGDVFKSRCRNVGGERNHYLMMKHLIIFPTMYQEEHQSQDSCHWRLANDESLGEEEEEHDQLISTTRWSVANHSPLEDDLQLKPANQRIERETAHILDHSIEMEDDKSAPELQTCGLEDELLTNHADCTPPTHLQTRSLADLERILISYKAPRAYITICTPSMLRAHVTREIKEKRRRMKIRKKGNKTNK